MHITATEIKFKSPWAYVLFLIHVMAVKKQMTKTPGLMRIAFSWNRTLSAWATPEQRKQFRNSGDHLTAMKEIPRIGRAKSVSWEASEFPSWSETDHRLSEVGF